ncbi:cell division protein CrgA [Chitinophaga vietnamensis]|uniref:cell division protein CrgA n=1 Tax=Chitinophaga vietnamensis TaxID=2593957 RepID=UPI0011787BF1|nr:cell division protein CrgA [Chitinophaga vietnamensis]
MSREVIYQFRIFDAGRTGWIMLLLFVWILACIIVNFELRPSVGWMIAIFVTVIMTGLILSTRWIVRNETVTVDDHFVCSALYGTFALEDIIGVSRSFWGTQPSLRLKIRNRRAVTWHLNNNSKGFVSNKAEELDAFAQLVETLAQRRSTYEKKTVATSAQPVSTQLEEARNKITKPQFAIPVGLAVGAVILVRSCAGSWFHHSPDLYELTEASLETFNHHLVEVRKVLDEKMTTAGEWYLYTNDTAAFVKLLPDVPPPGDDHLPLMKYASANKAMEAFLAHPDSVPLLLYVASGDSVLRQLNKGINRFSDSSEKVLYARAYDPSHYIKPSHGDPNVNDSTVFDVVWSISLADTTAISKAINSSIPGMNMMLSQIRLRPGFCFYLAARQQDSVSSQLFAQSVQALNKLLLKYQVDTSRFVMKTFNRH